MKLTNLDFIRQTEKRNSAVIDGDEMTQLIPVVSRADKAHLTERLEHVVLNRFEPFDFAKERIIGNNDLMSINFLQIGYIVSKSVCRIHVRDINGKNEGYGTGFLISENVLMTNNHVLEDSDFAVNSMAEFNYQYNLSGEPSETFLFSFIPSEFFYTNKELDFTIVAIESLSKSKNKKIQEYGYLKLFQDPNKILISEYVSIIQHPGGGYKQIAIRENQVITKNDKFITYSTDTAQGSSGSPVLNDQWQLVALHHSGVPRKDDNGNYLCKDGSVFQQGMDESLIDWVSNEGVRVSEIVNDISLHVGSNKYTDVILTLPAYLEEVVNLRSTDLPTSDKNTASNNLKSKSMNEKITITVPLEISVGIGTISQLGNIMQPDDAIIPKKGENDVPFFLIEKAKDQKYSGRNGYDADFIKTNNFNIEINDLLKGQIKQLAPILNPTNSNQYFLHYFNFSVAINKHRKLCVMTAVNIDGNRLNPINRENTKWILDPRMDEKYQTGPKVYADNDLDRGHMVRRLDPVWGSNAEAANDDTFHFSNSTPQHKNLNQKTWLSLENYILDNAGKENLKVSVFTGPVFSQEDIPYRGTLLPLQFWKVAALIKEDGTPSVTGYMLHQPDEIDAFRTAEGIHEDGFGQFKTYQVPLQKIANLTEIPFDRFNQYDPLNGIDFNETKRLTEITKSADVRL